MFFFDSLEVGHLIGVFSSFSGAGQTNNAEGSFFLTFRSNREIFFCSFFLIRLRGWWGNERYSLRLFLFFERKHHLFSMFFKLITDVRSHIRIGLAFRDAVFHRFGFFSFVDLLISQSDLFLFAFFCFLYFLFFESRDDDEVAYLVYVVRNDEVG